MLYETKAVLLLKRNLNITDSLGIFYTREFGKYEILLKSIKKPTSKLQYKLRDRSISEIEFILGKSFARLIYIDNIDLFTDFRLYKNKLILQSFICEFVNKITELHYKDTILFDEVLKIFDLIRINNEDSLEEIISYIVIRIMYILGFGIDINQCIITGNTKSYNFGINIKYGCLIDLTKNNINNSHKVTLDNIKTIRLWQKGEYISNKIPFEIIKNYLYWYDIKINSLKF